MLQVNQLIGFGAFSAAGTSYTNTGGTGDRTGIITVTSGGLTGLTGSITNLVDGAFGNDTTDSAFWSGDASNGSQYIQFAFSAAVVIDEAKWYQDVSNDHGTCQWWVDTTSGGSFATNIGTTFTLGGTPFQTITTLNGNTSAWQYWRLYFMSGTRSGAPYNQEIEFKISGL